MSRAPRSMERRVRDRADERAVRLFVRRLAEGTRRATPLPHPGSVLARMLGRPRRRLVRRSLIPIRVVEALSAVVVLALSAAVLRPLFGDGGATLDALVADAVNGGSLVVVGGLALVFVVAFSSLLSE